VRFGPRGLVRPFFRGRRRVLGGLLRGMRRFLRLFDHQVGYVETVEPAQLDRHVFIDGAGMRLLLRDAEFREPLQYFMSFDFQLPRQLIDPNLLHR
jgi:hypothetical protein